MLFGPSNYHLCHCLTCEKTITQFQWDMNNGVCDDCPKLTEIAPQFWKVINHLALRGNLDAQETMKRYG